MKTIRIGNDINVTWKFLSRNGMPYSLEDKEIELWLTSGAHKMRVTSYEVESENEISFSIESVDLKRYGVYKLTLRIFDNVNTTEDSAFDLVQMFQIVSASYSDSSVLDGAVDLEFKSVLNNVIISAPRADSGTTENRPSAPAAGQMYFDLTLGKPVWWNGSDFWVDATGASV